jgi:thioredoxin-related protein
MKQVLFIVLLITGVQSFAQQIKNFTLANVLNDQSVSLNTYPSCEGMVIIFTSNNCPYDEYYRARIAKLAKAYHDRVPFLLVNSGAEEVDSKDNMVRKAKQLNLSIPYLADKDQTLMANLDAKKSPEVFLLKNTGGNFSVVYRGAIDDNPQVEADVRQNYLRDAIDIMLTNQKIETPEVRPVGCSLKKKS